MHNMICVTLVCIPRLVKNVKIVIYSDTVNVIHVKLCMILYSTTHWAYPVHNSFSDLGYISRLQQCWNSFNREFCFLIKLSWNFVGLWSKSSRWWICHCCSLLHIYKGYNIKRCVFWFDKNSNVGFLADTA